jgi:hypothetical protein
MPIAIFGLEWTMELVYMACAAAGGTVLVLQTVLMLFGVGDSHPDVDVHTTSVAPATARASTTTAPSDCSRCAPSRRSSRSSG